MERDIFRAITRFTMSEITPTDFHATPLLHLLSSILFPFHYFIIIFCRSIIISSSSLRRFIFAFHFRYFFLH